MNKKLFIGATVITVTVVGTVVYYRHHLLKNFRLWLDDPSDDEEVRRQAFLALQEHASTWPKSGAELHQEKPHMYGEDGRPIHKEESAE